MRDFQGAMPRGTCMSSVTQDPKTTAVDSPVNCAIYSFFVVHKLNAFPRAPPSGLLLNHPIDLTKYIAVTNWKVPH